MAKKPTLAELKKKIAREQNELDKLNEREATLQEKITRQKQKVSQAEVEYHLALIKTSHRTAEEWEAFALSAEKGGTDVSSHESGEPRY
ncbi:hypothetical protein [Streptococcus ovuberis]|uniref:DUF4315 family protein n=1 Tax=Streptococcus ovuberis TaxID=1936207 RepID=A0A7X6MYA5_9STRE|nr:hypothetical protein [Streptococcus ovuberis]NKZ19693.1 hypothetical protein [Streptococcus ovuberis]